MFTEEECSRIISYSNTFERKHISDIAVFDNLDYYYHFILRDNNTQWVFDKISNYLKSRFPFNNVSKKESFNLQMYKPGSVFLKHVDADRNPDHLHVVGVILNSGYEGGDFIFHEPYEIVPKETGYTFDFNTLRPHEVTKIEQGTRWTLIGFLTDNDLNIKPTLV